MISSSTVLLAVTIFVPVRCANADIWLMRLLTLLLPGVRIKIAASPVTAVICDKIKAGGGWGWGAEWDMMWFLTAAVSLYFSGCTTCKRKTEGKTHATPNT